MEVVIAVVAAAAVVAAIVIATSRRNRDGAAPAASASPSSRLRPAVAEFHVADGAARVHFDVPLPAESDEVLADLLGREAVEVVREKRHTLPIDDVHRVVALGRRGGAWVEVVTIGLDTPGFLPPPVAPDLIPHAAHDFDPFERLSDLPEHAPGLAAGSTTERLDRLALRLPGAAAAGVRALGVDPAAADAPTIVLALLRRAGYTLTETAPGTYRAERAGQRTFVRVVPHGAGDYPELDEKEVRRFVVDFASAGAGRGILLSEKWSPFEIHERERRDPRVRFVTRERLQGFADTLSLG